MDLSIARVELDGATQEWCGSFGIEPYRAFTALEEVVVGFPKLRRLSSRLLSATYGEPSNQSGHDGRDHFVLNREDIFDVAVIALGPEMISAGRLDQLSSDPHAIPRPADTSLNDEASPELAADFLSLECLAFERKGRVPCDHHQVPEPAQFGGDIFRDPVREILLCRITAHIV